MGEDRISSAIKRIEAAMERISTARNNASEVRVDPAKSPKLMSLVNSHERLREEVAETMRDLDALITELEA